MTDYFDEVKFKKAFPHFYCEFSPQIFDDWDYEQIYEYLEEYKIAIQKTFNIGTLTDIGNMLTNFQSKFMFGIYKAYYGWEIIVWDSAGIGQIYKLTTSNDKMTQEEISTLRVAMRIHG